MLGTWCPLPGQPPKLSAYVRDPNCPRGTEKFYQWGYDTGQEWACTWTLKRDYGSSNRFEARYYYEAKCSGEGAKTRERGVLGLTGDGTLYLDSSYCKDRTCSNK